jgi:hypothetical protein
MLLVNKQIFGLNMLILRKRLNEIDGHSINLAFKHFVMVLPQLFISDQQNFVNQLMHFFIEIRDRPTLYHVYCPVIIQPLLYQLLALFILFFIFNTFLYIFQ